MAGLTLTKDPMELFFLNFELSPVVKSEVEELCVAVVGATPLIRNWVKVVCLATIGFVFGSLI
jgi:hypothetical protein